MLGCVVVAKVVYPRWIEPLVTIDDAIAELENELHELQEQQREVDWAKREYEQFVHRVGTYDMRRLENDVRVRLNELIESNGLQSASVTPSRATTDRKTKLAKKLITVNAEGTLESAIKFLRDVSELPPIVRALSPVIYPASGSMAGRKGMAPDRVSLRVPLQLMAIPPKKITDRKFREEDFEQPGTVVRHSGRDYSAIWDRTPLIEYVKLDPLVVTMKEPEINVQEGRRKTLDVQAKGGDGRYAYAWSPSDGLGKTDSRRPKLDTKDPGKRTYSVTVSDGSGLTAKASVNVTVTEKKGRNTPRKKSEPVADPGPQRFTDGRHMRFVSMMGRNAGGERLREAMIYNTRSRTSDYYQEGQEFDGGTLVYMHQTGLLVRRRGEYFVYPIGSLLDRDVPWVEAVEYPYLQKVAAHLNEVAASSKKAGGSDDAKQGDPSGKAPVSQGQSDAPKQAALKSTAKGSTNNVDPSEGQNDDSKASKAKSTRRKPGTRRRSSTSRPRAIPKRGSIRRPSGKN